MKRFIAVLLLAGAVLGAAEVRIDHIDAVNAATATPFEVRPVTGGTDYESELTVFVHSMVPGALFGLEIAQFDADGKEVARVSSSKYRQRVVASAMERKVIFTFKSHPQAVSAKAIINYGGNPLSFTVKTWKLAEVGKRQLFKGIYDPWDAAPEDRAKTLEKMKALPLPVAKVIRKHGKPVLTVNGEELPLNGYKGFTDYKLFGEAGGDLIVSFNCGQRLWCGVSWDKALWDNEKKCFDFTSIEDNLLRIYHNNPKAKVILAVGITPPTEFLEAHPESIVRNAKGVKGKRGFSGFKGWSDAPLKKGEGWAFSYASKEVQDFVCTGLTALADFVRQSPAGKIVIGFQLNGGMDGQFVQWEYGAFNGHFDYSESYRKALCEYLKEIYGSDAALQKAWDDPNVTLASAANPTLDEFRQEKHFDDRPGLGRKLADCRRFIAISTARMLNRFSKTLKAGLQRPSVVLSWYSTAIWAQPSRLALDELIKDDAVNMIGMVSYYAPSRALDDAGASANSCIQALNIRNLLYIQEMDHRTWRTQRVHGASMNAVAFPADPKDFHNQLIRDGASVVAAGGQGFYLYDMFGSWYHAPEAKNSIATIFAMNKHAYDNAGKFAAPKVAIFMDEATRTMSEEVPNYVNAVWRTSGVTPALHFMTDITNPLLPEYDLYIFWSPLTLTRVQFDRIRKLADKPGKILYIIGDAGRTSRDFSGTVDVLDQLGMGIKDVNGIILDDVVAAPGCKDPAVAGIDGTFANDGMHLERGKLVHRIQFGAYAIDDPQAVILGVYKKKGLPALARKKMSGGGTLYYSGRNAVLGPQLLHNLAREAGIHVYSTPGNAVYVGNGVAAIHRLSAAEPVVDFGREVTVMEPLSKKVIGKMRYWKPQIAPGECAAVCYLP